MEPWIVAPLFIMAIALIYSRSRRRRQTPADMDSSGETAMDKEAVVNPVPLIYEGQDLHFSEELIRHLLVRHFPFFTRLIHPDQDKFISRLRKFIRAKIFVIHDSKGFREMPILISASAIQLTFGLNKFLLPHFSIIQIYPQEFIALEPLRVLIGNVSGNTIHIAWKQFLEGYRGEPGKGNVGLHEMAHALYYQNFETDEYTERNFKDSFQHFTSLGDKIFAREKFLPLGLYSDYATRNFQEFWAESIEIFFQDPGRLQDHYPDMYRLVCDLLCQDPLNYPDHYYPV
jgi:Mlc titration factor MtfA (ptsG expression regulator)